LWRIDFTIFHKQRAVNFVFYFTFFQIMTLFIILLLLHAQ
jgi:hypothetical protein